MAILLYLKAFIAAPGKQTSFSINRIFGYFALLLKHNNSVFYG